MAFALANPAMKVLYTVVGAEEKYKAQNFNDTVVFRGGDAASAWALNGSRSLGLGIAPSPVGAAGRRRMAWPEPGARPAACRAGRDPADPSSGLRAGL